MTSPPLPAAFADPSFEEMTSPPMPSPFTEPCPTHDYPNNNNYTDMERVYLKPVRQILELSHELLLFWREHESKETKPWKHSTYPLVLDRPLFKEKFDTSIKLGRLLWYLTFHTTPRELVASIYGFLFYAIFLPEINRVQCGYGAHLKMEELYALVGLLEQIKFDCMPRSSFPKLYIDLWRRETNNSKDDKDKDEQKEEDKDEEKEKEDEDEEEEDEKEKEEKDKEEKNEEEDETEEPSNPTTPLSFPRSPPAPVKRAAYEKRTTRRWHPYRPPTDESDDEIGL